MDADPAYRDHGFVSSFLCPPRLNDPQNVIYPIERGIWPLETTLNGRKMTRKIWAVALIACVALTSGALAPREATADIINGVATQDLFQTVTVGRRGSVDSGSFDYVDDDARPSGSSGIVGIANAILVGPVMPDPDLPFSFPGTTAVGLVSGRSETTFNSSNDIGVELSAFSSLASIDPANGIPGTYGANVQADSIFNFQVDRVTEAMIEADVIPRSSTSGWQVRLSGGPAGFVFNRLTNPGSDPLDFAFNVTLFPGWDYTLRSNISAGTSASPGGGDSASGESISYRFRTTSVPEPGSLAILGLGAIAGLVKRKRRIA